MNKNIYTLKDFIKDHKNAKISYLYSGAVGGGVAVADEYPCFLLILTNRLLPCPGDER